MIFEIMGYIFCLLSCKKIGRKGEIPEEKRDGVETISDKNNRVGTFSERKNMTGRGLFLKIKTN